jgi:hypothetical protein
MVANGDESLSKINIYMEDTILWSKYTEISEIKYCKHDTTNIDTNIVCKNMIDEDSLCLWDRYYEYLNREFLKECLMNCSKCEYCNNSVYFMSSILDELTKGSMNEYENKLAAYFADIKENRQCIDDDDYECNLCISCDPFYNYLSVPDINSQWYDDGHTGYDNYYYKYSRKSNIEVAQHLADNIKSVYKNDRKKIYLFLKERMNIIVEDLIKVVFHPKRYTKYMNINYSIITDNYEYEL